MLLTTERLVAIMVMHDNSVTANRMLCRSEGKFDADGRVVASGKFSFDANVEKMYLTITADSRIMEDKDCEG